jgi:phosphoribosyl-AMP cyclohydrolase
MDIDNRMSTIEESLTLSLNYSSEGLIPAILQDADDHTVLMMAWMNEEAFTKTCQTGLVHFWSRSRNALWLKGESSGALMKVQDIRVDCDQDCILLSVLPASKDGICHTGRQNCFYRRVLKGDLLEKI